MGKIFGVLLLFFVYNGLLESQCMTFPKRVRKLNEAIAETRYDHSALICRTGR